MMVTTDPRILRPPWLLADCPQWDHVVQLHVCCSRDCKPCPPLVWDPPAASTTAGSGGSSGSGSVSSVSSGSPGSGPLGSSSRSAGSNQTICGAELGRWITPFR